MFIVLKIEVKLDYSGNLEYVQDDVIGVTDSLDEAKAILKMNVNTTLENGYFDQKIYNSDTAVQLTNGGTAYLKYCVRAVEEE